MAVLDRSELEASPLADLHAIASQVGLDGFRRLRKAELIDVILGDAPAAAADAQEGGPDAAEDQKEERSETGKRPRRRRSSRLSRSGSASPGDADESPETAESAVPADAEIGARRGRSRGARAGSGNGESGRKRADAVEGEDAGSDAPARVGEGVVEVLGNGSAFLRVDPPEPSDEDVYISAAQVRRCELVSSDHVAGPVRTPRRSERYPSLVRIDTINGASAESVADGARYEDLPVDWPSERIALNSADATLEAIEWLTPIGRGSRALILGARRSGKTETLRHLFEALSPREDLEVSIVLAGARPEEISQWQDGSLAPTGAVSFAASADAQGQVVERAIDAGKRVASRGGHALLMIDSLDGLHPHAARKALAGARCLRQGGSLTVIATATQLLGGETTVIALDGALTSTGRQPILDLIASGTLKPELLVGDDGAEAITRARAAAVEAAA